MRIPLESAYPVGSGWRLIMQFPASPIVVDARVGVHPVRCCCQLVSPSLPRGQFSCSRCAGRSEVEQKKDAKSGNDDLCGPQEAVSGL